MYRQKWYVYIITNYTNSVLYIGMTNNIESRIYQHKHGLLRDSFSKKYQLYKLVWMEEADSPEEAIAGEKRIKGWKREKKNKLIESINPHWENLLPM